MKEKNEFIKLSRTVSHALRHAPAEYGLQLDAAGWVEISALLQALKAVNSCWSDLTTDDLHSMAAAAEKQRYEFSDSRIRAFYGHSFSEPVEYDEAVPPDFLYHGTTQKYAASILEEGLKSMKRQYVHLSADLETATQVALRRTSNPVLLKINAKIAHSKGTKFYIGNDKVWLAKYIDKKYINM